MCSTNPCSVGTEQPCAFECHDRLVARTTMRLSNILNIARSKFYKRALGEPVWEAFLTFEEFCNHWPAGPGYVRSTRRHLIGLPPESRLEALAVARANFEIADWRNDASHIVPQSALVQNLADQRIDSVVKVRRDQYRGALGDDLAAAFVDFEDRCAEDELDDYPARVLEWILTVRPEDRMEGLRLARA